MKILAYIGYEKLYTNLMMKICSCPKKHQGCVPQFSCEPQLVAYRLGRNSSEQPIVLYNESDSCVHNLTSPLHHLLHTPPALESKINYINHSNTS